MALTKEDLQAIAALMDSKLEPITECLDTMQGDISNLQEGLQQVRASQLKVELEQYPRIAAALDGVFGSVQKDEELSGRISYLEKKADIHDTRLYGLETKVNKAL